MTVVEMCGLSGWGAIGAAGHPGPVPPTSGQARYTEVA